MSDDNGLMLEYEPVGKNGRVRLTARLNGVAILTDKLDLALEKERAAFINKLCKARKGIDRMNVTAELERIVGEMMAKDANEKDGDKPRKSQADVLVELASVAELFHTPGGYDSEGYATVPVGDHRETWHINSKAFRRWLSRLYYLKHKKATSAQVVQDAVNVLAGMAIHDGPEIPIAVRIAEHAGNIYLDLADKSWRAVEITATGWRVVDDPPVRFCRRRGMLALPAPVPGGKFDELRGLINVPDEDAWRLFVGWLVASLRPGRPFPILIVNGEQGSAKSTACRIGRALIDPNVAPLRRPPRDDRDLMIAANNAWIIGYDNLSALSPDLSDAICSLATGGGFATRELYSDGDEKLFSCMRPVIINGIEELATRSDVLDRAISLVFQVISDESRQEEDVIWQRFYEARPRILGALLDAVVAALANKGRVKLPSKPRMADFASWVVGAESALGWPPGSFLAAYRENRSTANAAVLEESLLAPLILSLMEGRESWQGRATDLLTQLADKADEKTRNRKDWPGTPRKLSGDLRRLAPDLRRGCGLEVRFDRGRGKTRQRLIFLDWVGKTPSEPSDNVRQTDCPADDWTVADDADGAAPTQSGPDDDEEVGEWTA